jgi:adenylyl-sulfate kinase
MSPSEHFARWGSRTSAVVWLEGLSGAGKSTLARGLDSLLADEGYETYLLDADEFRDGVSAGLGFSAADRTENLRRAAEVAALLVHAGHIVIAAFISPVESDRRMVRDIVRRRAPSCPFIEVFVSAPLAVCEARDVKHLYRQARTGVIRNFTGVSAAFEVPTKPDLVIDTATKPYCAALDELFARVERVIVSTAMRNETASAI